MLADCIRSKRTKNEKNQIKRWRHAGVSNAKGDVGDTDEKKGLGDLVDSETSREPERPFAFLCSSYHIKSGLSKSSYESTLVPPFDR